MSASKSIGSTYSEKKLSASLMLERVLSDGKKSISFRRPGSLNLHELRSNFLREVEGST